MINSELALPTSPIEVLKSERVPLADLMRFPGNPKDHDLQAIIESIRAFGFIDRLVINLISGRILSGHGRIEALASLMTEGKPPPPGIEEVVDQQGVVDWIVPVDYAYVPLDKEAAAVIALNRTVELGGWDEPALADLLQAIQNDSPDLLPVTGFDADDLDALLKDLGKQPKPGADPGAGEGGKHLDALQQKWGTESGQLWALDSVTLPDKSHWLYIGDATDPGDLVILMGDLPKAACLWTDPPYGVDYTGKTKDALKIKGDGSAGLFDLLVAAFTNVRHHLIESAPFYVARPAGALQFVFGDAIRNAQMRMHEELVWVKDSMVLGHSDYHLQHETILYGWMPGTRRAGRGSDDGYWYGDNAQVSTLFVDRPKSSEDHPTMKPPALIELCLANSTGHGDLVLDPFMGSGSTMVAAENIGRHSAGLEIDPRYAAVILERLSAMGLTARRVDD